MDTDKKIEVIINGKPEILDKEMSLLEIVQQRGLYSEEVVIEYNLDIMQKDKWKSVKVGSGDKIEIVRFMVGG